MAANLTENPLSGKLHKTLSKLGVNNPSFVIAIDQDANIHLFKPNQIEELDAELTFNADAEVLTSISNITNNLHLLINPHPINPSSSSTQRSSSTQLLHCWRGPDGVLVCKTK